MKSSRANNHKDQQRGCRSDARSSCARHPQLPCLWQMPSPRAAQFGGLRLLCPRQIMRRAAPLQGRRFCRDRHRVGMAAVAPPQQQKAPADDESTAGMKTFALALGGGGARGLAHIAVIEALDEMGVTTDRDRRHLDRRADRRRLCRRHARPDIRRHVIAFAHDRGEMLAPPDGRARRCSPICSTGGFGQATQVDAEKFCAQIPADAVPARFRAACDIPLIAMATDLHRRERSGIDVGAAATGARRLDGASRPVAADRHRRPHPDRRRRHQSAAVRSC